MSTLARVSMSTVARVSMSTHAMVVCSAHATPESPATTGTTNPMPGKTMLPINASTTSTTRYDRRLRMRMQLRQAPPRKRLLKPRRRPPALPSGPVSQGGAASLIAPHQPHYGAAPG